MEPKRLGQVKDFTAMFVPTGDYDLYVAEYVEGGTALMAVTPETGEEYFTASVYMEGMTPDDPNTIWVKSWSENEGIMEELVSHGVLELTGQTAQTGFVTAHEAVIQDAGNWNKDD